MSLFDKLYKPSETQQTLTLCSKCIATSQQRVTELTRRKKITCDRCGKRGYGCDCRIGGVGK